MIPQGKTTDVSLDVAFKCSGVLNSKKTIHQPGSWIAKADVKSLQIVKLGPILPPVFSSRFSYLTLEA